MEPEITQFDGLSVVAFQVVDSHDGDSARGDQTGTLPGVVRPLLTWHTQLMGSDATEIKDQLSLNDECGSHS